MKFVPFYTATGHNVMHEPMTARELQYIIEKTGFDVGKIAEILSVSRDHVTNMKNGKKIIPTPTAKLLRLMALLSDGQIVPFNETQKKIEVPEDWQPRELRPGRKPKVAIQK